MKRFMGKALGILLSVVMMVSLVPGMAVFAADSETPGETTGDVVLPEEVQNVIDMIKALPSIDNITLDDYDAVGQAENAFIELDEGERYSVAILLGYDSIDEVISLFSAYREKRSSLLDKALEEVVDLIDAIPENLTLEDADAVAAARKAYDELGGWGIQSDVSNYDKLVAAEKKLVELKAAADEAAEKELEELNAAAAEKARVDAVIELINALPDPENVIYDNYYDIQYAYVSYLDLGELKDNVGEELVDKLLADLFAAELLDIADSIDIAEKFLDQYTSYLTDDQIAALKNGLEGANAVLAEESPEYEDVRNANVTLIVAILEADKVISLHFTIVEGEKILSGLQTAIKAS